MLLAGKGQEGTTGSGVWAPLDAGKGKKWVLP